MTGKCLVLASHNRKKAAELYAILEPLAIRLLTLADFPGAPVPEEDGATFEANAIIKAVSALRHTGLPSLADDSGLAVDVLNGAPGVLSARYAGEDAGDRENNFLLLRNLAGREPSERRAAFVSVVALALPGGGVKTWRGEAGGTILDAPRGEGGFGYDPLFLSDDLGVTFAQAGGEEKNRVSHRGRALAKLIAELREAGEWPGQPIFPY